MKNLIFLLSILTLFSHSCIKELDEPDPNEEPSDNQSVLEADIGPEGGKLETEDFILTVPEGAFDTTATLKLTLMENDPSASTNQATGTYRLTGLNCLWSKPLEFKIRYKGSPEGESYIALGFNYYDIEPEDSVLVDELLEAVDSAGFLTCTLPPLEVPESVAKSVPLSSPLYHPVVFHKYLVIRGFFNKGSLQSECAFVKYDKTFNFDRSKVEQFANYIDEAVYFFHAMGIMDKNIFQGLYKLKVNIVETQPGEDYPSFIEGKFEYIDAYEPESQYKILTLVYSIKIPAGLFENADSKQMRMVAGEGVFRFENYCYFRKTKNWLQWALNYWVREYFYGSNPDFKQEEDLYPMFMQPFHGMNAVIKDDPEIFSRTYEPTRIKHHGFGMSSLMKYLFDTYNEDLDLLDKIFTGLQDGSETQDPIDVILNCIEDPEYNWWPEFIKKYLTGNIWEIPAEKFLEEIDNSDQVNFIAETDTVKYFDRSYMDLSGGLCRVNLTENLSEYVLGDGDKLNFKLGPESLNMDYVKVLVFKYRDRGGEFTFLGEGQEVTVNNVKALIDDGYTTLLAAVVNSANESPYKQEMNIELTIRMIGERTWPWKYVSIDALVTNAILQSPTIGETLWGDFRYKLTDHEMEASEDGTRFTTSWLNQTSGYKVEGGIDITVDAETFEITGFYVWSNSESISDNKVTLSERTEIRGKEGLSIPVLYWDNDYLTHQVSGEEVCTVIENWTYEYRAYPGESYELKNTLESYTCDYNANLIFFWARELEE